MVSLKSGFNSKLCQMTQKQVFPHRTANGGYSCRTGPDYSCRISKEHKPICLVVFTSLQGRGYLTAATSCSWIRTRTVRPSVQRVACRERYWWSIVKPWMCVSYIPAKPFWEGRGGAGMSVT